MAKGGVSAPLFVFLDNVSRKIDDGTRWRCDHANHDRSRGKIPFFRCS